MEPTTHKVDFPIKTEAYEGPLGLVLDLIESRKLLVNELALASITDDFIRHVKAQDVFPVEETANFIQIAAMLLLVKSKSLIPDLALTDEEQEDVDDLKRRLEAYEKVREAARELGRIYGKTPLAQAGERIPEITFAPARDFVVQGLAEALSNLLAAKEAAEKLPEARVKPMVTIEEMMDRLAARVQNAMNLSFKEFTGGAKERVEVVVSFLALLELVKQGAIAAEQYGLHGDIRISHTSSEAVPRYG